MEWVKALFCSFLTCLKIHGNLGYLVTKLYMLQSQLFKPEQKFPLENRTSYTIETTGRADDKGFVFFDPLMNMEEQIGFCF